MASRSPVPIKYPPGPELARRYEHVLKVALSLPGVEDSRSYGTPAIKVKGKLIARLRSEAEGALALACDFPEREMLLQAAPETFFFTDHYADYPMVLINLDTLRWEALPQLIEDAYRLVAPKRLIAELDS